MNELKITLDADDSVSQEDLLSNYRDLEDYLRDHISDLQRTEIKEDKQSIPGARGDASIFWMVVTAAPAYIEVALTLVDHWNKRDNNLPGKKNLRAKSKPF